MPNADQTPLERAATLEEQLRELLTVVSDALRRARDGVPEEVRFREDLHYTTQQIARARSHLRACAATIEGWSQKLPSVHG